MPALEPLQIGVVFWTGGELGETATPDEIASRVAAFGLSCGQLAVHGTYELSPAHLEAWRTALDKHGITTVTLVAGFAGESYETIPVCAQTVGYVPPATRAEREQRSYDLIDFAASLGIPSFMNHIGCVTHDRNDPDYTAMRDLIRRICDKCAEHGMTFAMETGQEPADVLNQFIADVDRQNLKVNFDPANMILYGSGDPIDALETVKEHVVTVHCKDGSLPPAAGEWGTETPLGQGDVGFERFIGKLKEIGYTGPLTIEREITGDAQREDILSAVRLLEGLRG